MQGNRATRSSNDDSVSSNDDSVALEAPRPAPSVVATGAFPGAERAERAARDTEARLGRLEGQNRRLKLAMAAMALAFVATLVAQLRPDLIVEQKRIESEEIALRDASGTPRLFVRMYSGVPVLQLLDRDGRARMSMGLQLDDAPFLDLSDEHGQTRARLALDAGNHPTLELFDADGGTTYRMR